MSKNINLSEYNEYKLVKADVIEGAEPSYEFPKYTTQIINQASQNMQATRPKVDGICDNCGSKLEIRSDDNEETFKIRYDEYMNNTKPVVDYFNKINRLGVVNVTDNLEETLLQVEKYLEV